MRIKYNKKYSTTTRFDLLQYCAKKGKNQLLGWVWFISEKYEGFDLLEYQANNKL